MLPWNSRRTRRNGRARRRPDLAALESLEGRELLSSTPLGHALPDLTISGFTSTAASWGHPLGVTVDIKNIAAESQVEPLNLIPGATSYADAPAEVNNVAPIVAVYASRVPRLTRGSVRVGTFTEPAVPQNSDVRVTTTITLPNQPRGLPGDGGKVYFIFVANASRIVPESDLTNNVSNPSRAQIVAPLPELVAVALDVPPVLQPGDTIQPTIRIANFGPVDTSPQQPVVVALVASDTPSFGPLSSIVGLYSSQVIPNLTTIVVPQLQNIPGVNAAPSKVPIFTDANVTPSNNIVEVNSGLAGVTVQLNNNVLGVTVPPLKLPTTPGKYYIGVVIDPFNQLRQIQKIGGFRGPQNPFNLAHLVGPPVPGLPSAGVLPAGTVTSGTLFPYPITTLPVGNVP